MNTLKKTILVTGANGQLGQSIKSIVGTFDRFKLIFTDSKSMNICDINKVRSIFQSNKIDYCINCAAYTKVDLAESEPLLATKVNKDGVENLVKVCNENDVILIHVSTDFVFDGESYTAYAETDVESPIGIYGSTKLEGEKVVSTLMDKYYIIRTSWLYSEFQNNFMKTMLRLGLEKDKLSIVYDQIGTPTYAVDLAKAIMYIIDSKREAYGTYHYSNLGVASWYDFAKAIFEISNIDIEVNPIKSILYPTPAKRPQFSVLNTEKIRKTFHLDIPYWRDSLTNVIIKSKNEKK